MQNTVFQLAKDGLLQSKRAPTASRKATFCKTPENKRFAAVCLERIARVLQVGVQRNVLQLEHWHHGREPQRVQVFLPTLLHILAVKRQVIVVSPLCFPEQVDRTVAREVLCGQRTEVVGQRVGYHLGAARHGKQGQ